jgi:hypothetical protein
VVEVRVAHAIKERLRKLKRRQTFWPVLLIILSQLKNISDAISHWQNIQWVLAHVKKFAMQGNVQIVMFIAGLLWLAVIALWPNKEIRRGKIPHLSYVEQSGGLYDLQKDVIGFFLMVKNDEQRYESIARSLRAKIRLQHHFGEAMNVSGVWMTANNQPRQYTDVMSLGMNESACLLLVIWNNWGESKFYAAGGPMPPALSPDRHLELGEWSLEVLLEGDNNFKDTFTGKLRIVSGPGPSLVRPNPVYAASS